VRSIPGVVNDRKTAPLFFFNSSLFGVWKGPVNKETAVDGETGKDGNGIGGKPDRVRNGEMN
jgi:hypothetical protein